MSTTTSGSNEIESQNVCAVWAKAGSGTVPHPLICHAVDTAIVAELIFEHLLGPVLRERLSAALAPLGDVRRWAGLLCGLHDLGKCSPTFQGLKEEIAQRLLRGAESRDLRHLRHYSDRFRGIRTDLPHGLLTAVHMERLLCDWGASPQAARTIAQVLGGHHGYLPSASQVRSAQSADGHSGGKPWQERCDGLVSKLVELWGFEDPKSLPWGKVSLDVHAELALAALASTSDWIASSRPPKTYAGESVDLPSYVARARQSEEERVAGLRWEPWVPPADTTFKGLFPASYPPRPVQTALQQAVDACDGAGVFVISAPTGEGKTKAGLQAVASMVRKLQLNGFYLAMPTKVSGNQGFEVAREVLAAQDQADLLHLFHSSAAEYLRSRGLQPSVRGPKEIRAYEIAVDGDGQRVGEDEEDSRAGSWFDSLRKRVLLAPVGVGTVDQTLMAAIRSGHVFVRLAGLSSKVVLFDEVHSYDVHMSTLMERLLGWLGSMRVPVVLLSATLSTGQQHAMVQSWRAGAQGRLLPEMPPLPSPEGPIGYPRLLWADTTEADPCSQTVEASDLNSHREVALEQVDFTERVCCALKEAAQRRCVAMVHNVVSHADEAWRELKKAVKELAPEERPLIVRLHARLPDGERAEAEELIRRSFGEDTGERPTRAIVVGSPLLEQSLDVDFDVVISAVAPVDSLIQRMGRIHRHRSVGPDSAPLRMILTGFPEPDRGELRFPKRTTNVYDEAVLLRSWALFKDLKRINCPDDVQSLIDKVYDVQGAGAGMGCPPGWEKQWQRAEHKRRERIGDGDLLGSQEYVPRMIRLPAPHSGRRLHELTDRGESPRRTRRDSGPKLDRNA